MWKTIHISNNAWLKFVQPMEEATWVRYSLGAMLRCHMATNTKPSKESELPQIKEIDTIFALTKGSEANISYALFKTLDNASLEERPKLLQYIAEHFGQVDSSEEIPIDVFITGDEVSALKGQYAKVVDSILEMILKSRPSIDDFYASLNSQIIYNPLFADEKSRTFAMYWILVDRRIPYFQLDQGLKISNDEWQTISRKLTIEKQRIRFILASDFSQRSEEADLLLKEIDSREEQERVYLLGYILFQLRDTAKRSAQQS